MCRDFSADPLPDDLVDRLVDRARRAPSAGHTQGWAFVVLTGAGTAVFWDLATESGWRGDPRPPGVVRAPVIVLPLVSPAAYLSRYSEADKAGLGRDRPEGWPVPYWLVDGAMAVQLLLLGAVAEGVGALLFALHREAAPLLAALGVPSGWEPLGAVALGWPAPGWRDASAGSAGRGRRALSEVLHRGQW